jgi:hypothetical protein
LTDDDQTAPAPTSTLEQRITDLEARNEQLYETLAQLCEVVNTMPPLTTVEGANEAFERLQTWTRGLFANLVDQVNDALEANRKIAIAAARGLDEAALRELRLEGDALRARLEAREASEDVVTLAAALVAREGRVTPPAATVRRVERDADGQISAIYDEPLEQHPSDGEDAA